MSTLGVILGSTTFQLYTLGKLFIYLSFRFCCYLMEMKLYGFAEKHKWYMWTCFILERRSL